MAKTCMMNREKRRVRLVQKYAERRAELKRQRVNPNLSEEERALASRQLWSLPRDSCPARLHNRCRITGRAHGYYRKFGLARSKLREAAMRGDIPGLTKASW